MPRMVVSEAVEIAVDEGGVCSATTEASGERLLLLGERAAFWPRTGLLLIADLHLGKGEAFRAAGVPLSRGVLAGVMDDTLERLTALVRRTRATGILVVGDLLHAPAGLTEPMIDAVTAWRSSMPDIRLMLVPGNHDRRVDRVADVWSMELLADHCTIGDSDGCGLSFCHDPCETRGRYTVAGHVHPAVTISGNGDSMKLPCFVVGRRCLTLPAFSRFTAGVSMRAQAGDRLFAIAEGAVFEA